MKNVLNPSYSAKMNDSPEEFTLVVHVPELPSATGVYKDSVYFLETDKCFYQCVELNDVWIWRKVTFGPNRQFVLPVNYLVVGEYGYTFDDEIHALRQIILEMKKYDDYFTDLHSSNQWIDPVYVLTTDEQPSGKTYYVLNQNGWYTKCTDLSEFKQGVDYYEDASTASLNQVITLTNKVIEWVNYTCKTNLDYVSDGISLVATPGGATCEELATSLNLLIGVLNPHANFSIEINRIDLKLKEIQAIIGRDYSMVKTADSVPDPSKTYYTLNQNNCFDPVGEISEFENGVDYYEVQGGIEIATPEDFTALKIAFDSLKASYEQFIADKNFLDNTQNAKINALFQSKDSNSSDIEELKTKSDTIIKTYIGWDKYASPTKISVIERLAAIEEQMTPGSEGNFVSRLNSLESSISGESGVLRRLAAVEESLNTVSQSVANANTKATNANNSIATLSENNSNAHSVFTEAINNLNSSVRGMLTVISSINLSEDSSLENVVAAVRAIIAASQNILNGNSSQEGD